MPQQHLPGVEHVEPGADPDRVDPVLALGADPLGVEVGLGQVAGERGPDRGHERDHARDPGEATLPAPGRHPELAPQVHHHEREEQLDAPEVERVHEVPQRRHVPPGGAPDGEHGARDQHDDQGGQREDAEHVDPGGHVGGLPVRECLTGWDHPGQPLAQSHGPAGVTVDVGGAQLRGHGRLPPRLIAPVPTAERDHQGQHEDHDHREDDESVGDADVDDAPVQVAPGLGRRCEQPRTRRPWRPPLSGAHALVTYATAAECACGAAAYRDFGPAGAPAGTRTQTERFLRPLPLPLGYGGRPGRSPKDRSCAGRSRAPPPPGRGTAARRSGRSRAGAPGPRTPRRAPRPAPPCRGAGRVRRPGWRASRRR